MFMGYLQFLDATYAENSKIFFSLFKKGFLKPYLQCPFQCHLKVQEDTLLHIIKPKKNKVARILKCKNLVDFIL